MPGDEQLLGKSKTVRPEKQVLDPQLLLLIERWPTLSQEIQQQIVLRLEC
ncbi:hypothetical protein [Rubritalea sp.]